MDLKDCIVTGRIWRDGVVVDDDVTPEDISLASRDEALMWWIDMLAPSEQALADLAARLGLAPTTVEDAVAPHERPKVTRHGESLFFTLYTTQLVDPRRDVRGAGRLHTGRLSGIVLPHALITIRLDDSVDLAPVLARWEENADLLPSGVGALLHGLLDVVVDGHFETIQALDDEIEALEDELFAPRGRGSELVERVYRFRKDLVALRRVVLPMREVVNAVVRHRSRTGTDLDHWYDDLYDHVLRAGEWTESLRDLATSVFETNLSLHDARLNTIMKKLAGWGAIIAIPTAITGWFGMNVPYPGFSKPAGLYLSITLIVTLAGGLYLAFKRRDWL